MNFLKNNIKVVGVSMQFGLYIWVIRPLGLLCNLAHIYMGEKTLESHLAFSILLHPKSKDMTGLECIN